MRCICYTYTTLFTPLVVVNLPFMRLQFFLNEIFCRFSPMHVTKVIESLAEGRSCDGKKIFHI